MKYKKALSYVVKILISGGLLWYLFTKVPFADIWLTLRTTDLVLYSIAFILHLICCYLAALQFRVLNLPFAIDLPTVTILKINLITTFYSSFLPGYLAGGAVKWVKMQQYIKRPAELFISIVLNRFIELGSVFIVGAIFMIPYLLSNALYTTVWILIGISVIFIALYCSAFSERMLGVAKLLVANIGFLPHFIRVKIEKLFTIVTRLHELPLRTHLHILGNSVVRQFLGIGVLLIMAHAVSISVSYSDMAWIRSVVIVLGMLPISIGNLGVREASLVVMMEQFGIVPALALSFSFLILLKNAILSLVGGVLELIDKPKQRVIKP